MPTYHYRCRKCSHEFEEFQAMSDDPITVCPKCGGETHRLISGGTGFIFKGSGFYTTDYKNRGTGQSKKESSSSGDKSAPPPPPATGKDSKS